MARRIGIRIQGFILALIVTVLLLGGIGVMDAGPALAGQRGAAEVPAPGKAPGDGMDRPRGATKPDGEPLASVQGEGDERWADVFGHVGVNSNVSAMVADYSRLYVGGGFNEAGGEFANHLAMWDGSHWHPLMAEPLVISGRASVDSPTKGAYSADEPCAVRGDSELLFG